MQTILSLKKTNKLCYVLATQSGGNRLHGYRRFAHVAAVLYLMITYYFMKKSDGYRIYMMGRLTVMHLLL